MHDQEVIADQKKKIRTLQEEYDKSLHQFVDGSIKFSDVHLNAVRFFGFIEECCASNNSSTSLKDSGWNQWLAETCLDLLPLILSHFLLYRDAMNSPDFKPSGRAYAGMQRLAKRIDEKAAQEIRSQFADAGFSTYGFDTGAKIKMSSVERDKYLGYIFAVVAIVVILITTFTTPNPTSYQYTVYRIVLALAAGGIGAVLPGLLEVKFKGWLRASGAAAFFAIVYFKSPALLQQNPESASQPVASQSIAEQ